jgi:hypothetical protein
VIHRLLGLAVFGLAIPSLSLSVASLPPVSTAQASSVSVPSTFGLPGPLAETVNGTLYVASGAELYKLVGARLEPFVRASGQIGSAVATETGTVYLGETFGLQAVSPRGTINVVVNNEIERLVDDKFSLVVNATRFKGLRDVPSLGGLELGNVAADGAGDLYISAAGDGYDLYELTKAGTARFVSPFRGANGKPAPLSVGPDGVVYGEWQTGIDEMNGGGISAYQDFSTGSVSQISGVFLPAFIAASAKNGYPLYTDAIGEDGFSNYSAIIAIEPNHRVVTLWSELRH